LPSRVDRGSLLGRFSHGARVNGVEGSPFGRDQRRLFVVFGLSRRRAEAYACGDDDMPSRPRRRGRGPPARAGDGQRESAITALPAALGALLAPVADIKIPVRTRQGRRLHATGTTRSGRWLNSSRVNDRDHPGAEAVGGDAAASIPPNTSRPVVGKRPRSHEAGSLTCAHPHSTRGAGAARALTVSQHGKQIHG